MMRTARLFVLKIALHPYELCFGWYGRNEVVLRAHTRIDERVVPTARYEGSFQKLTFEVELVTDTPR